MSETELQLLAFLPMVVNMATSSEASFDDFDTASAFTIWDSCSRFQPVLGFSRFLLHDSYL